MPQDELHQAQVLLNDPAGRGYYRLLLRAPDAASTAVPGQFVMLRVSENRDPLLARPFGISSVLAKKSIELYYRIAGRGTSLLTAVEPGRYLSLLGPLGNGFPSHDKSAVPVLVAGGSGFPPLLFLAKQLGPGSGSHLFYGARNRSCLISEGVVTQFRKYGTQVHLSTEDGSQGKSGLVTDILSSYLFVQGNGIKIIFYACGPRPMLRAVSSIAAEHSIPCFVSMEERMACGLGVCMGCSVGVAAGGYKRVCKEGPVFDSREIDWREEVVVPAPAGKR